MKMEMNGMKKKKHRQNKNTIEKALRKNAFVTLTLKFLSYVATYQAPTTLVSIYGSYHD